MFEINISEFVQRNLPDPLRRPILLAFMRSILAPFGTIQEWFATLREVIRQEYRWNFTMHSMTKMLNDTYDPIERRIYITVVDKLPIWFWKEEAEQPDWVWKDEGDIMDWYWLDEATFNTQQNTNYEFTVHIPIEIPFVPSEMMDTLELYRFAGYRPRLLIFGLLGEVDYTPNYNPG